MICISPKLKCMKKTNFFVSFIFSIQTDAKQFHFSSLIVTFKIKP